MPASPPDVRPARIALWGWGRETQAAYRALRAALGTGDRGPGTGGVARVPDIRITVMQKALTRFLTPAARPRSPVPGPRLTLFCSPAEATDAARLADPHLDIRTTVDADALAAFDLVIKSPGISPYRDDVRAARARGTRFVGGTALWFAAQAASNGGSARTLCVTGTKGKSTTTALLAHLLRAGGHRVALAGNIGLPLLELPDDEHVEFRVVELSSYQTGDVADAGGWPDVAIVLNLFPEHLDWHGSHERYVADKLRLVTDARPRVAVLNAGDPALAALRLPHADVRWFNTEGGWHLRGTLLCKGAREVMDTATLPLAGHHNRSNLCAVLTALDALGLDGVVLAPHAATFQPLPHRLQAVGARDGVTYVNDSISTTPHASLAALDVFGDRPTAILVGGHDRGLPWDAFVDGIRRRPPHAVVTMGANGPRIHELVAPVAAQSRIALHAARDMDEAVRLACAALPSTGGVVLLSPGAPSFGAYRDYVARGRDFARAAGFDPDAISSIAGMGVA